jgi:hypothetical protein
LEFKSGLYIQNENYEWIEIGSIFSRIADLEKKVTELQKKVAKLES